MRRHGLLDRFPAHLLSNDGRDLPTLIVPTGQLGRLQLHPPIDDGRIIIVLSKDGNTLREARDAMAHLGERNIHFVQADPVALPLRDDSIACITTDLMGITRPNRTTGHGLPNTQFEELVRVLCPLGRLIEFTKMSNAAGSRQRTQSEGSSKRWAKTETFFVRPSSADTYFVTRQWTPSPWLFRSIDHGWIRSLRMSVNLLISRFDRLRPLYDGVRIVIRSNTSNSSLITRLSHVIQNGAANQIPKNSKDTQEKSGVFIRTDWNALLVGGMLSKKIVKLPLHSMTLDLMDQQLLNIDALESAPLPLLAPYLPKRLGKGVMHGQPYWVEARIAGISATAFRWNPVKQKRVASSALDFILALHRSTQQSVSISRKLFDDLVEPDVKIIEDEARQSITDFDLSHLVESLWNLFCNRCLPLVWTHGDFWPGNLLVSNRAELSGVIDWDASLQQGWPLIDLLHYITFQHKWQATRRFGAVVTRRLIQQRLSRWENHMIKKYCATIALEKDLWSGFVALYWMQHLARCIDGLDTGQMRRDVFQPLPEILRAVSHAGR